MLLDIMYLDRDPVLHIIDEATIFSTAIFLPSIYMDAIWETIVSAGNRCTPGLPNKVLSDQGSQIGDLFIYIAK